MRRPHATAFTDTKDGSKAKDGPKTKAPRITKVDLPKPTRPSYSGSLLSCGQNDVGQLGFNDDVIEKSRPALVPIKQKAVAICAGGMHSLFLTETGDMYSFGCNDEGALGRDTSEEGSECIPTKIDLPGKCVKFSAGDSHSACLLDDGRVFAWGSFRDSHGSMGLTTGGKQLIPLQIMPAEHFVDVSSGTDHLALLTNHGKVYTIGCAEQGQLGRGTVRSASGESRRGKVPFLTPDLVRNIQSTKPVDAIWTTSYCTFMREMQTGKIYAFGMNNYNQLGVNKKNNLFFSPVLSKFQNVQSIDGGQHHTIVLTNDNKCHAIGRKDYGRLGIPDVKEDLQELKMIPGLKDKKIKTITCGESCSFALTEDGKVYAWGMGTSQQLGTGSEDDILEPTLLTGKQVQNKVLAIASGGQHSLFIVEDKPENGTAPSKTGSKKK